MLEDWGQSACGAFSVDMDAVIASHPLPRLRAVHTAAEPHWQPPEYSWKR